MFNWMLCCMESHFQ
ncbi:hypothetical protein F383_28033 [Gossypium arboreum]|uniref:Uncharacterized protein n=1 Tax=Gossypium arboreum TaxID=29729 RepID=A0A0B0MWB2_GOSAR|nr:hypothetical protein F383_28033 [Gossypium arboreum]